MSEELSSVDVLKLLLPKMKKPPGKYKRYYTQEHLDRDRERMARVKPWEKSTGARTPEGKKKVSMNAYKHGRYSKAMKEIEKIERDIKRELKDNAKKEPGSAILH